MQENISLPSECPSVDCKIFDGASLVNMLAPNCTSKTFLDYCNDSFIPYLEFNTNLMKRVDLVFDRYLNESLKSATRSNCGIGVRQKVTENGKLPSNWETFLRCSENKSELLRIVENFSKLVITTVEENVICNQQYDLGDLMPCNMEEADERMLLHVNDASKYYSKHLIKTVDSDIVVNYCFSGTS